MNLKTLLLLITALTSMWLLRLAISGSSRLNFLVINVLLCTVPFLLEYLYPLAQRCSRSIAILFRIGISGLWILFLPNTFYVLTDFMHLNSSVLVNKRNDGFSYIPIYGRGDGIYVYDSLLIFCIALFGAYMGGLALVHAYRFCARRLNRSLALAALGSLMVLAAIGVYIGRFSRYNSYEGVTRPVIIAQDLLRSLSDAHELNRFLIVTLSVLFLEIISYMYVRHTDSPATPATISR
jgi:uncharacterized membrane protein